VKAILHTRYGPPDELELKEIEKPAPRHDQVSIRIRASTVTSSDCNIRNRTFVPGLFALPSRLQSGLTKPRIHRLGMDLAGEIEAVGKDVHRFQVGDQVFGSAEPALGAYAEYLCLPEAAPLAKKPDNLTWEEAACLPLAGITALYFIRDQGNVRARQQVLIHGASGAIGTFAVQLAKYYGAQVSAVCSATNVEMVRALGADRVIDYTKEDVTKGAEEYDVILDAVNRLPYSRCKTLLKRQGLYLSTLPTPGTLLQMLVTSLGGEKKVKNGTKPANVEDLIFLGDLAKGGKLRSVIDRRYPLEQTAEAFRYVEKGHKKGSVVITVAHGNPASPG
jgi:NADPH:quinone reductase-like Zn-dependent oxidoreductase